MSLSVCRLELAEVGRGEQVGLQACQHESLEDLGHSRQVGDRFNVRLKYLIFKTLYGRQPQLENPKTASKFSGITE